MQLCIEISGDATLETGVKMNHIQVLQDRVKELEKKLHDKDLLDAELATIAYMQGRDAANKYQASKKCENCKHIYQGECNLIEGWDCYHDQPRQWSPPNDFSCNQWSK